MAAEVAKYFVDKRMFSYGPPKELLAENGRCFTAKGFQNDWEILAVRNLFRITYYPSHWAERTIERHHETDD